MRSANLFGPLKGLCPHKALIKKYCDVQIVHYCPTTILMSARIVQNTIIDCICINATIQRQDEIEKIWDENRKVIECLRI